MPPKKKFTKEAILNAAFDIARKEGAQNVNVRMIAKRLGCSTQPVMYHYSSLEMLKEELYQKADDFHTAYITNVGSAENDLLFNIGMRYITFAVEEKHLFRFLFQSDSTQWSIFSDLDDGNYNSLIAGLFEKNYALAPEQCREAFILIFMFVHGYASVLANDSSNYSEPEVRKQLTHFIKGTLTSFSTACS